MKILRLDELVAQGKLAGQRVFIRADLNVPQDDAGRITEDTRIRASVPCIQMALAAGAAVMVTSHLGRPTEGKFNPEDSLRAVVRPNGTSGWIGPEMLMDEEVVQTALQLRRAAVAGSSEAEEMGRVRSDSNDSDDTPEG